MKIYRAQKNITVQVQPGTKHPENSAFVDAEKHPTMFSVEFKDHLAIVSEPLGKYMIAEKIAHPSLAAAKDSEPVILVPAHA